VWALVTGVALVAGAVVLAVWLAIVAAVSAAQAARTHRGRAHQPVVPAVMLGAALAVIAGLAGPVGVLAGGVAAGLASMAWAPAKSRLADARAEAAAARHGQASASARASRAPRASKRGRRPARTSSFVAAAVAALPGLAGASVVAARRDGVVPAMVLFAQVSAFDAGYYIVGAGARRAWYGVVAGILTVASVSLWAAAVFAPPFEGASPWVLGGIVAVLAPAGAMLATAILGDRDGRVPGLRRLDSLTLAGPAWVVAASFLLS
jgi:hypothetical protein